MPVPLNLTQLFANSAVSLLATSIDATSTSLTVLSGQGSKFPQPTGDGSDYFLITLEDQSASIREVIKVTARSGDVLSFSLSDRGLEGTTARAWSASPGQQALVDCRITAETLDRLSKLPAGGSATLYDQPFEIVDENTLQLEQAFKPNTVRLYVGGLRMKRGVDFTESTSNQITLLFDLNSTDVTAGQNVVIDFDPV